MDIRDIRLATDHIWILESSDPVMMCWEVVAIQDTGCK